MAQERTLNIRQTTIKEVIKHWQVELPITYVGVEIFVRCNAKGEINWDKTMLYRASELFNIKVEVIKIKINQK